MQKLLSLSSDPLLVALRGDCPRQRAACQWYLHFIEMRTLVQLGRALMGDRAAIAHLLAVKAVLGGGLIWPGRISWENAADISMQEKVWINGRGTIRIFVAALWWSGSDWALSRALLLGSW